MHKDKLFQISTKTELFQLVIFYTLAHVGILFLLNAKYWDDWVFYSSSPEQILTLCKQLGSFANFIGYLQVTMLAIGPWFYKISTFFLILFTGLSVWKIAKKQSWLTQQEAFYISLFFLITPLYIARVALVDFQYTLSVFLFFLAWSLIGHYRILTLILFFLSFTTQSLLVFYALPIIDWYFRESQTLEYNKLIKWCFSKLDFLIIPFLWFLIKIVFFKPHGIYAGYNEHYQIKNLFIAPIEMLYDFLKLNVNLSAVIALSFLVIIANTLPQPRFLNGKLNILYISLLALFCGLFPYFILGHVPTFIEWTSRHQLLMPVGLSLFFVWIIGLSKSIANRKLYIAFFISVCLFLNFKNYCELFFDWKKQEAIIDFIALSDAIKKSSLVVVDDKTGNALGRTYRFYEWNGILKLALGDESHIGINSTELIDYNEGKLDKYLLSYFNTRNDFRNNKNNAVILTIEKNGFLRSLLKGSPEYTFTVSSLK